MTLAAESPSHRSSKSIDDFAAFLEKELDEENEEDIEEKIQEEIQEDIEHSEQRNKKIKVMDESTGEETATGTVEAAAARDISDGVDVTCSHPIVVKNLCSQCGKIVEEPGTSVAFNYIYKDLRVEASEAEKLGKKYMKHLLKDKKLILVLDLDHTLINSAKVDELIVEEEYILDQLEKEDDDPNRSLYLLDKYGILTKLRPFVRTFLKEAKVLFEMYIYTMSKRGYADEIARLLDPEGVYFPSRVICRSDNTTRNKKGLDVVIGSENLVIILDDSERVWENSKENLILMQKYHYFARSVRKYSSYVKSLSELNEDERESDGILASILNVLKRAHELFFDPDSGIELPMRDVRQILPVIKKEILHGCNIVFSRVFPSDAKPEEQRIWKLAEDMGAICFSDVNDSVTHVVVTSSTTMKAEWARDNKKFVVTPVWIEAAHYFWKRQKEEDFPVLERENGDGEGCVS